MANSAFTHNPTITVPGSSTNTALVRWSGTGADTFLDSTIIVGATTMGLAADTDLLTFGNGTLQVQGAVTGVTSLTASAAVTGATLVGTITTATQNSITTMTALTSVATIGTGVWNGTAVITTYGGTGLASYTAGDMFYYASGTTLTKLAKGSANEVLTMNDGATAPEWEEAAGGPTEATQAVLEEDTPGSSTANTYISPEVAQFHPGVAKGWIKMDGTGTISILANWNVDTITDNSAGNYTIAWEHDFSSAHYNTLGSSNEHHALTEPSAAGTAVLSIFNSSDVAVDTGSAMLTAFGDQT